MNKWYQYIHLFCIVLSLMSSGKVFCESTHPGHAHQPSENRHPQTHPTTQETVNVSENLATEETNPFWDKLDWGAVIAGAVQGNTADSPLGGYTSQADALYHIDLDALFHVSENSSFYALLEIGGGYGVDGRVSTFSSWSDYACGEDDCDLAEVWYEHQWLDGRLSARFGKIDLTTDFDTNEYANDEHCAFTSSGFCNNLTLDPGGYSVGSMVWWKPTEKLSVGIGYQSNSEWNDLFHNGFCIMEIGWHPIFSGHQGNYRFFGWTHSRNAEENFEDYGGLYTNKGWGFSFDQEITEHFGIWCRYGSQSNEGFNDIKSHTSFGVQFMQLAYRPEDTIGFAYGIAQLTDAYATTLDEAKAEKFLELYYRFHLTEKIAITPHLQWVKNPEGDANRDDATVVGFRGTIIL